MIVAVETEEQIAEFLAIRSAVDPENRMTREGFDEEHAKPARIDVLLYDDGVPVGCAFATFLWSDPSTETAYLSIRTLAEHRRPGHGTTLLRHCSDHFQQRGCTSLYAVTAATTSDMLGFLGRHGFVEVGRMQDVELELADADPSVEVPAGIELVPLTEEHEEGAYAVALKADADIPAPVPMVTGDIERWRGRNLGPLVERELSFVALADGRVVGFAILGREVPGVLAHYMTGILRDYRGRGIAQALKSRQIAAARAAGWKLLRTQNDLGNAPMRAVNERLGYRSRLEWVHLRGPVLG